MKNRKVEEIILPYMEGIPLNPSVNIDDKIVHAIELMVDNSTDSDPDSPFADQCL